jgi:hypothetical protein
MGSDVVADLGLADPDVPLQPRRRAKVTPIMAPEDQPRERPAAAEPPDPFAKWPDGRIQGMFSCKPQPTQWFATDRLLAGRAHVLAGAGGSSKTRMQYHLAVGAVLGRLPWGWQVATTGSAALFLTEDTIDDSHRVLHVIGAQYDDADRALLEKQMRVYQLAGFPVRLLQLNGQALVETDAYDWLMQQIDKLPKPVAYIGIDPALGVTEGDELSASHQRRLGELMDRIAIESGACVVLTTHAAKSLHQAEELGSHASRGSGAITDAVRGEYVLRSMTADEARRYGIEDRSERQRYVQLVGTKGNSLPPDAYAPVWLRRGEAGVLSAVTLEQVERGTVGDRELRALDVLRKAHEAGETTLRFWQGQCEVAGLIAAGSEGAREKAMQRIKSSLLNAGSIAAGSRRGLWIPS